MKPYSQLALSALFPVIASVILYLLDKKTKFKNLNYWIKQIIFGVIFGGLAIVGNEWGVEMGEAQANTRDASVLTAGLIFGAPAGIIAGVIGGVERIVSPLIWHRIGVFTSVACGVSTIVAGLVAAVLRKCMFDGKKPSPFYALAIGLVVEVFHMLMIFFTNMDDPERAFRIVENCTLPMVLINGIAVFLSVLVITLIGKERIIKKENKRQISTLFQFWLLITVVVAFVLTSIFTAVIQFKVSETDTERALQTGIIDVTDFVEEASDEKILEITQNVSLLITDGIDNEGLRVIASENSIIEISIINPSGIIYKSSVDAYVDNQLDMNTMGEQTIDFMANVRNKGSYVQKYQPQANDPNVWRKYSGVMLENYDILQIGYDAEGFQKSVDKVIVSATQNRTVGQDGGLIVLNSNEKIVACGYVTTIEEITQTTLDTALEQLKKVENGEVIKTTLCGEEVFCMQQETEGYYVISVLPVKNAIFIRDLSIYITVFMEIIVFVGLFILVYFLIKRIVVDNIHKINNSLMKITSGNLNEEVNVRSNEEFASLSDDINQTVSTLKRYIEEAASRIDKELEFAKSIQSSALPSVFPPYPDRKEFDIYASTHPAKEVGGDFYDFYFVGHDKLAFLIADVSGKGIPAALFMMTSKTLIKSYAESGKSVDEVFTLANARLCENNEASMFVTSWMGILDLTTGVVEFVNAGHNSPLVKHKDGAYEYLKARTGFLLAGMDITKYSKSSVTLQPGDRIYLYTDGVTEANNSNTELYGEDRLQKFLNNHDFETSKELCDAVKKDVDEFVGEAPQFDDVTMLAIKYNGFDND